MALLQVVEFTLRLLLRLGVSGGLLEGLSRPLPVFQMQPHGSQVEPELPVVAQRRRL
jgi:hypothetical protein